MAIIPGLDKDISVEMVYSQLRKLQSAEANFQWNESIDKCWILSNMDGSLPLLRSTPIYWRQAMRHVTMTSLAMLICTKSNSLAAITESDDKIEESWCGH